MNYADIKNPDFVNGKGVRISLFVSGCKHGCIGCFNKIAWDYNFGKRYTKETENYILKELDKSYIKGLSVLGGEPLDDNNVEEVTGLLKKAKSELKDKDIWLWSGYTFEELIKNPLKREALKYIDVLIDGKFDIEKKDLKLYFKGSSNQRVIDVQKSLEYKNITIFIK